MSVRALFNYLQWDQACDKSSKISFLDTAPLQSVHSCEYVIAAARDGMESCCAVVSPFWRHVPWCPGLSSRQFSLRHCQLHIFRHQSDTTLSRGFRQSDNRLTTLLNPQTVRQPCQHQLTIGPDCVQNIFWWWEWNIFIVSETGDRSGLSVARGHEDMTLLWDSGGRQQQHTGGWHHDP